MEIIIVSKVDTLSTILLIVDKLIVKNHWHNLGIYADRPMKPDELKHLATRCCRYLIMLDITNYPNWEEMMKMISNILPQSIFTIIAEGDECAKNVLNTLYFVIGYINISADNIEESLECILKEMYSFTVQAGRGVFIQEYNEIKLIPFESIIYIETIKSSHFCSIYTDGDVFKMRANINKLITQLDCRFIMVRSSTIVNISKIEKMNTALQNLSLRNGYSCAYSKKNQYLIKKNLGRGEFLHRL